MNSTYLEARNIAQKAAVAEKNCVFWKSASDCSMRTMRRALRTTMDAYDNLDIHLYSGAGSSCRFCSLRGDSRDQRAAHGAPRASLALAEKSNTCAQLERTVGERGSFQSPGRVCARPRAPFFPP